MYFVSVQWPLIFHHCEALSKHIPIYGWKKTFFIRFFFFIPFEKVTIEPMLL